MGWFAFLLIGLAGWLILTGRLQRLTAKDGMMLGIAIVGAVMAAKGKPLMAALPILMSAGYFAWANRKPREATPPVRNHEEAEIAEARDLLGLPREADAEAVRAAHRRLIANVHPDRGGTPALAARINAARDLLLREAKGRRS